MARTWLMMLVASAVWMGIGGSSSVYADELPDFMEHWEFGWDIDEDAGPRYFADTIFPLWRHTDETKFLFLEPRMLYGDSEWLMNLGGGYRQVVDGGSWLLGGNMFYDYDSSHSHYRLGWGVEAISSFAEARANYYLGLSDERLIDETSVTRSYEKAIDGYDLELGMPVPYYSRMKMYGGFFWYDVEKDDDNRYGWQLRTEYKPLPFVVVDGRVSNDTKSNVDWGMTLAFKVPFGPNNPSNAKSAFQLDTMMFPESDVTGDIWRLVERRHEIMLEKYQEVGGVTVEILRGT